MQRSDFMDINNLFKYKSIQFFLTFLIAILGGVVFQVLHIPIPCLLGSMFFVFICSKLFKSINPYWPVLLRDTGIVIVGYTIGLSFTASTIKEIGEQLPTMILLTLILLLCTYANALYISKFTGVSFPTVLIGSIPGGLSQMITFADEIEGIDITVVTFLQVSRLMMIIFTIPFVIFSPLFNFQKNNAAINSIHLPTAKWSELFPTILIFAFFCILFAYLGKKIKFPTAFLIGPMVATILLNQFHLHGPVLPSSILNFSQLLIGGYIGLLLKPENLKNKVKIIILSILSGIVLLSCSFILSLFLTKFQSVKMTTAILSLAPGGMDQMAIIAKEVNANLSIIMCYQLFRTFFIYFAVPPLLKLLFNRMHKSGLINKA